MSISQNYPTIEPSLNLSFALTKKLDPRVTFSRPTTGVAYDGKTVAKAEENLLLRSQEFDNASWVKTGVTVTANTTTAPDGTTTAETLDDGTGTAQKVLQQIPSFLANTTYALSCFFKDVDRQYSSFAAAGAAGAAVAIEFDLVAGTVSRTAANGWVIDSSGITNVGDGWYRGFIVFTTNTSVSTPRVYIQSSDGSATFNVTADFGRVSYTGTNKQFHLWGAQLEQRSAVTAYTPTTTQPITNYIPVLQTASANVARFDHNPVTGESLGLLVEEQRTNLLTYSDDFSNAAWTKTRSSVSSNVLIAPDGTLTADKLVEDTSATNSHTLRSTISLSAVAHTFTVYAKAAERSFIRLVNASVTNGGAYFNLSTGALGTVGANATASITSVGNGWYRCAITVTAIAGSNSIDIRAANADNGDFYTGDGYSGIYIWGAQLEAGAKETTYIKTVGSQVTRAIDTVTDSTIDDWYNPAEFTMYGEYSTSASFGALATVRVNVGGNPDRENILQVFYDGSSKARMSSATVGNADLITMTGGVATGMKVAVSQSITNGLLGSTNGNAVVADTSVTYPWQTATALVIGGSTGPGTARVNGHIKKLAFYPKALSATELVALTS
jgi:hypothetical protein